MSTPPSPFAVQRALTELHEAQERLLAIDPDIGADAKLLIDSLEGMTDGLEVIDRLADAAIAADLLAQATKEHAARVVARAARTERQNKWLRDQIMAILQTLGIAKLQRPGYSATIQAGSPGVVITDETALPDALVRIRREPNKTAIGDVLKSGGTVTGAELRNAAVHLRLRV